MATSDVVMHVKFTINGKRYQASSGQLPIDASLNTFIRTRAHLTGSKFMCLEGGCGVCIVNVVDTHPVTKQRITFSVNSCLFSVFSCHGMDILTVEGIGSKASGYHPVQERLAQFNGTQCGFCSPGMVMSMYSLLEANSGSVTMEDVEKGLAGNICRCTGYRPILDAFKSFAIDAPPEDSLTRRALGIVCQPDVEDLPKRASCVGCERQCTAKGCFDDTVELHFAQQALDRRWYRVRTVDEIFDVLREEDAGVGSYILVAGNTGHGVYRRSKDLRVYIDVRNVEELRNYWIGSSVIVGANVTLTEFLAILREAAKSDRRFTYCSELARHVEEIAHPAVRHVGTIAGNLTLKHRHPEFPSDLYVLFEALGVEMTIASPSGAMEKLLPGQFLRFNMHRRVLLNIALPALDSDRCVFRTYKVAARAQNAAAHVNAAFLLRLCARKINVEQSSLCFGGIGPKFSQATRTEQYLEGKNPLNNVMLQEALAVLNAELAGGQTESPTVDATYRRQVAVGLLYRFIVHIAPRDRRVANPAVRSGGSAIPRPLSSGAQSFDTYPSNWPLTQALPKLEAFLQTAGEAIYVNDLPSRPDELHVAFVLATVARRPIVGIEPACALAIPGVVAFYSAKDIPGENDFAALKGNINTAFPFRNVREEILCSRKVLYHGQPIGIVVAKTHELANEAAELVEVSYGEPEDHGPILPTVEDVLAQGNTGNRVLTLEPDVVGRSYHRSGSTAGSVKITGKCHFRGHAHFTLEPQTCLCVPSEDGTGMTVYSATQSSHMAQIAIAKALGMRQSNVHVIVRPVGGSYGAKLSRGAWVASACALAAYLTRRPVRMVLSFETTMQALGKRIGARCEYEMDVRPTDGRIVRLSNTYHEDMGASNYEAMAMLFREAFRNCYSDVSWRLRLRGVFTDAPSTTWLRSPGTAESIGTIETIMEHIAFTTGLDPQTVRLANMEPGSSMATLLPAFHEQVDYQTRKAAIDRFNETNRWKKRGIAIVPMGHPITYFGGMNAWVSIYHVDGSVAVTIGTAEIGQGVNTKVAQVVAHTLGIPLAFVTVKPHTTIGSPNAFIEGGSISTDLVAYSARRACEILLERIRPVRADNRTAPWEAIVQTCYQRRVNLSASYNVKRTDLRGYTVWALCATELELDVLTGQVQVQRVDILEDTGESMNPLLDIGQIEGAFVMALGLHVFEELRYDRGTGALTNFRTWNYKPPSARDIPVDMRIRLLQKSANPAGVLRSKTTGEPAYNLGITVQFALRYALAAARRDAGLPNEWLELGTVVVRLLITTRSGSTVSFFFSLYTIIFRNFINARKVACTYGHND
uniref:Indole-3-acetaldehyde oxidase n=1 Tax=Anopheles dirus TaxID=7168 RepID=A0A182NGV5_9DIPT